MKKTLQILVHIPIRSLGLLLLISSVYGCHSLPPPDAVSRPPARVKSIAPYPWPKSTPIAPLFERAKQDGSSLSFVAWDMETQEVLAKQKANLALIPASTIKLFTAIAALEVLGPMHRFDTTLWLTKQGVLTLKGSGDPSLRFTHLMKLAQTPQLQSNAIKDFYYDAGNQPAVEQITPGVDPEGVWNPGIGGLSAESNQMKMYWVPSKTKNEVFTYSVPHLDTFKAKLSPQKKRGSNQFQYTVNNTEETWVFPPNTKALDGLKKLPVHVPNQYSTEVFRFFSKLQGIPLPAPKPGSSKGRIIAKHTSAPLVTLVENMLLSSNNLSAELLSFAAAKRLTKGPVNTPEQASKIISRWLQKSYPKIQWKGLHLVDGSGLHSSNRVTTMQIASLLKKVAARRYATSRLINLLPMGGWSGTLKRRLHKPPVSLRVFAKTGTLSYSVGLAGYLFAQSGKQIAFSVLVNDTAKRKEFDQAQETLSKTEIRKANRWGAHAKMLIDSLVTQWSLEL